MDNEEAKIILGQQLSVLKTEVLMMEATMLWKEEELRHLHNRIAELEVELRSL